MKQQTLLFTIAALCVLNLACSSSEDKKTGPRLPMAPTSVVTAENKDHPLAKFIELVGWRVSEAKGKIQVKCGVVNHSEGDISDLNLSVSLRPTTAKPEDPPFCTFTLKVPPLGPEEIKDATGECATTMRVYELPDWQFIKPTFKIATAP